MEEPGWNDEIQAIRHGTYPVRGELVHLEPTTCEGARALPASIVEF